MAKKADKIKRLNVTIRKYEEELERMRVGLVPADRERILDLKDDIIRKRRELALLTGSNLDTNNLYTSNAGMYDTKQYGQGYNAQKK